jgi:diguanylate cyclase (GGDEF)-like protein
MELQDLWPEDEREEHSRSLVGVGDVYDSGRNWRHLKADGSEIDVLTFGRRVSFEGRDSFLVSAVDITERRRAEARIAYMAHHDGLTNLPNRVMFQERLRNALERNHLANKSVAVLCIDLDLFKNVNDSFGHPVGDKLLMQVANRLAANVRDGNLVARLGGDEFAMILGAVTSPNEVSAQAAQVIEIVSAPYQIDDLEVVIGASIGIAIAPGDGRTAEELLRNADMALYRAKSDGGGVHHFFEKEMDRHAQRRRDMEIDLRHALANGEFELHYQPLVDLDQDRIVSFEALLRWRHPEKGMISPADFIPLSEDIGLIVPLGNGCCVKRASRRSHGRPRCGWLSIFPRHSFAAETCRRRCSQRWRCPVCRRGGSNLKLRNRFSSPIAKPTLPFCISCANSACAFRWMTSEQVTPA